MSRVHTIAMAALSAVVTLVRGASAATAYIVLSISGCEAAAVPADRLFDLVRSELAPQIVIPDDARHEVQAPHLYVRLCEATANGVRLEWQSFGGAAVVRQLDLSDVVGDLRARTLAVALAELVASVPIDSGASEHNDDRALEPTPTNSVARITPPTQPAPTTMASLPPARAAQQRPEPPPMRVEPVAAASAWAPALRVSAGAALREYFSPRTTLVGPWLSVATRRFAGEAQFLTTRKAALDGTETLGTVTLYDASLAGLYQALRWGAAIVSSANLCVELGNTWASGAPRQGSNIVKQPTRSNLRLAGALDLMAETALIGDTGLQLHLLLGGNLGGVTARAVNQPVVGTEGFFAGAALGLHYRIEE